LVRQPQSLDEARATAQMLEQKGYNFSVGVAQVNRANLIKYGLDSYEKAFDACSNLAAGSRILAECYANAGGDWGKAFSCYYSGNFVTGFRDGYVQKIYASIGRSLAATAMAPQVSAIPLRQDSGQISSRGTTVTMPIMGADSSAYRVAIRSVALDTVAASVVLPVASGALKAAPATQAAEAPPNQSANQVQVLATATATAAPGPAKPANNDVFVPKVRGPGDKPSASPASAYGTSVAAGASYGATTTAHAADPAVIRQGGQDDAFVF
jgi:type IV secretion system protein VirB1